VGTISLESLRAIHGILERRILEASGAAYKEIANKRLSELARGEYGIYLPEDVNFVGIAESSARAAGLPNPEDDAYVLLEQVLTRAPKTTDLTGLNRDYARATVLASLVRHLRDQGMSLKGVLAHPTVKELLDRYKIRASTAENFYNGKRPNKQINVERLWKPSGRDNALASYDPSKGALSAYLKTVLRNQAHDLKRVLDQESDVLSHSLRFKTGPDDDQPGIDPERSPEFSVDAHSEIESRLMVGDFRRKLKAKNPRYLELLSLLKDEELDISRERDHAALQRQLGIKDRADLLKLRDSFLHDLRLIFRSLDADAPLAESLLRAASARSDVPSPMREIEYLLALLSKRAS
jgi:hypothetical protein